MNLRNRTLVPETGWSGARAGYLFLRRRPSAPVAPRRGTTELSVERPLDPANPIGGVARLTARFESGPDGSPPSHRELAEALESLRNDLDALLGPPLAAVPAARPDRGLSELIETYRPRQRELVDALLDDGEITRGEHAVLVAHLATVRPAARAAPASAPPERTFDRPIAAVPIAADRSPETPRPVPELLRLYRIESLKQAGAVRARRQISFEEYMALKRHFGQQGSEEAPSPG